MSAVGPGADPARKGKAHVFDGTFFTMLALLGLLALLAYARGGSELLLEGLGGGGGMLQRFALLLIVSSFVPLYRLESGGTTAWQLIAEDWLASFPLAFVYLWPIVVLFVVRATKWKRLSLTLQFAEPFLAAASTLVILWIPQMVWEFEASLLPWLWIPISARPAAGVVSLQVCGRLASEDAMVRDGLEYLVRHKDAFRPRKNWYFYGTYYAMQAAFQAGGDTWRQLSPVFASELLGLQRPDGSWADNDSGQVMATSMAVISLAANKRYLPIYVEEERVR